MPFEIFDFSLYKPHGETSLLELKDKVTKADLYRMTDEAVAAAESILVNANDADVVFVPNDPEARDIVTGATDGWTIGHVVVHATASSEEAAAHALLLARGAPIPPEVRTRYETPWESITTIAQARIRLDESKRMRHAMFDAWPDEPHLDAILDHPFFGQFNAIGRYMIGLGHEVGHLDQLRETLRQSIAAHTR